VIQRHYKNAYVLFYCYVSLIFNYLIKKEQKHSHNPKSQKYFHNKP